MIKQLIQGFLEEGFASPELKAKRLDKCNTCPFLNPKKRKCKKCGCYVDLKAGLDKNKNPKKLFRIEKTHCPGGFWPYIDENGREWPNDKKLAVFYNNLDNQ